MCPNSICTVALHTPFGKYNSTVNGCRAERVKRKMKKKFCKSLLSTFQEFSDRHSTSTTTIILMN